jgi:hypothetical protein
MRKSVCLFVYTVLALSCTVFRQFDPPFFAPGSLQYWITKVTLLLRMQVGIPFPRTGRSLKHVRHFGSLDDSPTPRRQMLLKRHCALKHAAQITSQTADGKGRDILIKRRGILKHGSKGRNFAGMKHSQWLVELNSIIKHVRHVLDIFRIKRV